MYSWNTYEQLKSPVAAKGYFSTGQCEVSACARAGKVLAVSGFFFHWVPHVARVVKYLPTSAGEVRDAGSIPGWGRSPAGGHGNPLQYSCLENPTDRGAWCATVHGVTKSGTLKLLRMLDYFWRTGGGLEGARLVNGLVKLGGCCCCEVTSVMYDSV